MGNCLGQSADSNNLNQPDGNLQTRCKVLAKGQVLKREKLKWKSDIPLTTFQICNKRDEFWDTAPAFEGRQEIWDALKAAVEAIERNDYELAQAIIDGANIILPTGSLRDCYDELGNRYQLPLYVISYPTNLSSNLSKDNFNSVLPKRCISKSHSKMKSPSKAFGILSDISKSADQYATNKQSKTDKNNSKITLNLRLSTGKDYKILADPDQTVESVKEQFASICGFLKSRQRWYCYGKLIENNQYLSQCTIPPNFIIQVIVHTPGENNRDLVNK